MANRHGLRLVALLAAGLIVAAAGPASAQERPGVGLRPDLPLKVLSAQGAPYPGDTVDGGRLAINTPGAVYDGWLFDRLVEVRAPGVVIRNSLFSGPAHAVPAAALLQIRSALGGGPVPSATVEDSTFRPRYPTNQIDGVRGSNFALSRVDISGTVDGVHIHGGPQWDDPAAGNVAITASWIHDLIYYARAPGHDDGSHNDGVQIVGGRGILIQGNRFDGTMSNAAIMIGESHNPISDVLIAGNELGSGACSVNIADKRDAGMSGIALVGNTFLAGTQGIAGCGLTASSGTASMMHRAGNAWDSGRPLDAPCTEETCGAPLPSAGGGFLTGLGSAVYEALLGVFVWSTTLWLKPSVSPMGLIARLQDGPAGGQAPLGSQVMYLAAFVLALGLLSVAIQLIWRRDGATLADAATGLFRAVAAIFAGLAVVRALWGLSDALTDWIVPQSVVDENPLMHAVAGGAAATPVLGPSAAVLMLVMSLLGILLSLLMAALMLFRTGTVAVLAIMLPLAAAGSLGASTRQWLPKITGWILALIFMRPMAAAVYRIGLTWMTSPPPTPEGSPVTEQMTTTFIGLLTMACAALTLPAMLKLFTWMFGTAPTSSGAIGAGTLAGATGLITARGAGAARRTHGG